MISEKKSGAPYLNVWFGNFYRPAYDDQAFVAEGMELLKKLGFNSVLLDSKDWEDFRERYEGKPASQYVGMQEFMMEQIKKQGMSHTFLAIYLNADNLYPNIRFSPPVFGESVVTAKGNDGRWYRYWSEKAQETMTEHVSQLLEMYGENMTRIEVDGEEKKPLCSMWDPVVAPSFDEDGKKRYRSWLEKRITETLRLLTVSTKRKQAALKRSNPSNTGLNCVILEKMVFRKKSWKTGMKNAAYGWTTSAGKATSWCFILKRCRKSSMHLIRSCICARI